MDKIKSNIRELRALLRRVGRDGRIMARKENKPWLDGWIDQSGKLLHDPDDAVLEQPAALPPPPPMEADGADSDSAPAEASPPPTKSLPELEHELAAELARPKPRRSAKLIKHLEQQIAKAKSAAEADTVGADQVAPEQSAAA